MVLVPLITREFDSKIASVYAMCSVLDGANTSSQLGSYTPPVLVAVLDAAVGAEADGKEEEECPHRGYDETDWEEGQSCSGNDEGGGRGYGSRGRCGGLRVGICRGVACLGEDTVDK